VSIEATIAGFAAALRDREAPPPAGTRGRQDQSDRRRFAVYRNNVAVGLIGAIEARFPVVRRIVGAKAFRTMARTFVEREKPHSPVLIAYGDAFPDFIAARFLGLGPPCLVDVARLESAWVDAYHAEDATIIGLVNFADLDPAALPHARIALHPAVRLLRLATPAASIWASYQVGAEPVPHTEQEEDALIARPEADVSVRILPACGYAFAKRLHEGATLAEAVETLPHPNEFGSHLVGLVTAGAVRSIVQGQRP
jgi:hypothetical protein